MSSPVPGSKPRTAKRDVKVAKDRDDASPTKKKHGKKRRKDKKKEKKSKFREHAPAQVPRQPFRPTLLKSRSRRGHETLETP